jgi:hypothetical protein
MPTYGKRVKECVVKMGGDRWPKIACIENYRAMHRRRIVEN